MDKNVPRVEAPQTKKKRNKRKKKTTPTEEIKNISSNALSVKGTVPILNNVNNIKKKNIKKQPEALGQKDKKTGESSNAKSKENNENAQQTHRMHKHRRLKKKKRLEGTEQENEKNGGPSNLKDSIPNNKKDDANKKNSLPGKESTGKEESKMDTDDKKEEAKSKEKKLKRKGGTKSKKRKLMKKEETVKQSENSKEETKNTSTIPLSNKRSSNTIEGIMSIEVASNIMEASNCVSGITKNVISGLSFDHLCAICCEKVEFFGMLPCCHCMCMQCLLKQSILSGDKTCSLCRNDFSNIVFFRVFDKELPTKYPPININDCGRRYVSKHNSSLQRRNNIVFGCSLTVMAFDEILKHYCWVCHVEGYPNTFVSFHALEKHYISDHGRLFCGTCVEYEQKLSIERVPFTKEEYRNHLQGKKTPYKNLVTNEHATCAFCPGKIFYNSENLFRHHRLQHQTCEICYSREGQFLVFEIFENLLQHYEMNHYLCNFDVCRNNGICFSSDLELQIHLNEDHNNKRRLRNLPLNLQINNQPSINNRGGIYEQNRSGRISFNQYDSYSSAFPPLVNQSHEPISVITNEGPSFASIAARPPPPPVVEEPVERGEGTEHIVASITTYTSDGSINENNAFYLLDLPSNNTDPNVLESGDSDEEGILIVKRDTPTKGRNDINKEGSVFSGNDGNQPSALGSGDSDESDVSKIKGDVNNTEDMGILRISSCNENLTNGMDQTVIHPSVEVKNPSNVLESWDSDEEGILKIKRDIPTESKDDGNKKNSILNNDNEKQPSTLGSKNKNETYICTKDGEVKNTKHMEDSLISSCSDNHTDDTDKTVILPNVEVKYHSNVSGSLSGRRDLMIDLSSNKLDDESNLINKNTCSSKYNNGQPVKEQSIFWRFIQLLFYPFTVFQKKIFQLMMTFSDFFTIR